MMERLTKKENIKSTTGGEIVVCKPNKTECNDSCMYGWCKWVDKAVRKLKEYEDLEEQGLLLRLPCKVGDIVYQIRNKRHAEGIGIAERRVSCINIYSTNNYSLLHQGMTECYSRELNKTWVLTREEAEQRLKEMEG